MRLYNPHIRKKLPINFSLLLLLLEISSNMNLEEQRLS